MCCYHSLLVDIKSGADSADIGLFRTTRRHYGAPSIQVPSFIRMIRMLGFGHNLTIITFSFLSILDNRLCGDHETLSTWFSPVRGSCRHNTNSKTWRRKYMLSSSTLHSSRLYFCEQRAVAFHVPRYLFGHFYCPRFLPFPGPHHSPRLIVLFINVLRSWTEATRLAPERGIVALHPCSAVTSTLRRPRVVIAYSSTTQCLPSAVACFLHPFRHQLCVVVNLRVVVRRRRRRRHRRRRRRRLRQCVQRVVLVNSSNDR